MSLPLLVTTNAIVPSGWQLPLTPRLDLSHSGVSVTVGVSEGVKVLLAV